MQCLENISHLTEERMEGRTCHIKNCFNLTQPGLIHGICYVEGDSWKIQVKAKAPNGKVKTSTVDVDTAYVNCEFGKLMLNLYTTNRH